MSIWVNSSGDANTLDTKNSSVDMRNKYFHLFRIMIMTPTQLQRKSGLNDISIYCVKGTDKIIKREFLINCNKLSDATLDVRIKEINLNDDTNDLKVGYEIVKNANGRDVYMDLYASSETTYTNIYSQIVFSTYPTFIKSVNELVMKNDLQLTLI